MSSTAAAGATQTLGGWARSLSYPPQLRVQSVKDLIEEHLGANKVLVELFTNQQWWVQILLALLALYVLWTVISAALVATVKAYKTLATIVVLALKGLTVVKDAIASGVQRLFAAVAAAWTRAARRVGEWKSRPKTTYSEPVEGVPQMPEEMTVSLLDVEATLVRPPVGKAYFVARRANRTYRYPVAKHYGPRNAAIGESLAVSREQLSVAVPTLLSRAASWPQSAGAFYDITVSELFGHFNKVAIRSGRIDGNYLVTAHHVYVQYVTRIQSGHVIALVNPGKGTTHYISKSADPEVVRRESLEWAQRAVVPTGMDLVRVPFECQDFKSAKIARKSTTAPEFYAKRRNHMTTVMPTKLSATNIPVYKLHDASTDEGDSGCGGYESTGKVPIISYIHIGAHKRSHNNVCLDLTEVYPTHSIPTVSAESPEDFSRAHSSRYEDADIEHIHQVYGDPQSDRVWFTDDNDLIGNLPKSARKSILGDDGVYRTWAEADEYENARERLSGDSEEGYKVNRQVYDPEFLEERSYLSGRRAMRTIRDREQSKAVHRAISQEAVTAASTAAELKAEIEELRAHNKILGAAQAELARVVSEANAALVQRTTELLAEKQTAKDALVSNQQEMQKVKDSLATALAYQYESDQRVKTEREKAEEFHRQLMEERGKLVHNQVPPPVAAAPPPPPPVAAPPAAQPTEKTVRVESRGDGRAMRKQLTAAGIITPSSIPAATRVAHAREIARQKKASRDRALQLYKASEAEAKKSEDDLSKAMAEAEPSKTESRPVTVRPESVTTTQLPPAPDMGGIDAVVSDFLPPAPSTHDSKVCA